MDGTNPRLDQLESELKGVRRVARRDRWTVIGLAVVLALLAIGRLGQLSGATETLRVKQLLIQDEHGNIRANLSSSGLDLYGGMDKPSLSLSTVGDCALLYLKTKGRSGVFLSATLDGSQSLSLFDQKGNDRVVLRAANDESGLQLSDENGKRRAMLGVQGKARGPLNGAGLSLFDAEQQAFWQSPAQGD